MQGRFVICWFPVDAIFFLCLVRLLSQPDFYRILINFISILCAYICRYEFWISLSVTPWTAAVQPHCFFQWFTALFSGILLFNLKKKKSFCGWEHFEKVQIHASCNALKDVKKKTQKRTHQRHKRNCKNRALNDFSPYSEMCLQFNCFGRHNTTTLAMQFRFRTRWNMQMNEKKKNTKTLRWEKKLSSSDARTNSDKDELN